MNNGTYAATSLGDAMTCRSSGSFTEAATLRAVLDALDDATGREEAGEAALSGEETGES